ncbi:MAG: hypothetical protein KGM49_00985 [Sphingomonadales bacterium]|nr:hypothetical protein [Sphingomonadales bacterium]
MFGTSIFSVFRSRWKAVMWSAGILMTAYCSIPSPEESAQKQAPQAADLKALQGALDDAQKSTGQ